MSRSICNPVKKILHKLFLLLLLIFCLPAGFSLDLVGKILSVSGEVYIDIQGKNKFIKPLAGDLIYSSTIIKTEIEGTVLIKVNNEELTLPVNSYIKVADILPPCVDSGPKVSN
jgi:hypothetical protein